MWLQSVGKNGAVSHSGIMKGVTASLLIPKSDAITADSDLKAELRIRFDSGLEVDPDISTVIYVDPKLGTMDGWAEETGYGEPMSYWAGKVVPPPGIPTSESSNSAKHVEPSRWISAIPRPALQRPPSTDPEIDPYSKASTR